MAGISIKTLHAGLNLKDDATASELPEGATVVCVGADLSVGGVLSTGKGYTANDISGYLPGGTINCVEDMYIGGTRYVLASTSAGLYVNGVLKDTAITGRFTAISIGANIYITDGTVSRRFNGTTSYQLGIIPPVSGPTISAATAYTAVIDNFDSEVDWALNQTNCTITTEATIKTEGDASIQVDVTGALTASSYRVINLDLTKFSGDYTAYEAELIKCDMYTSALKNIKRVTFMFDVGDGSFTENYYRYSLMLSQQDISKVTTTSTGRATPVTEQHVDVPFGYSTDVPAGATSGYVAKDSFGTIVAYSPFQPIGLDQVETGSSQKFMSVGDQSWWETEKTYTPVTWEPIVTTVVQPPVADLQTGTWSTISFAKNECSRVGTSGSWATVNSVKFEIETSATVTVYLDNWRLSGGGKLSGAYYFMYGWGRCDSSGNVIHYSGPARSAAGTIQIQGPIAFERQQVAWGTRTASTDPQVNCCIIYMTGGTLDRWWVAHVITDNGTSSGSALVSEADLFKRMTSQRNEPAPAGTSMIYWKDRIWMVGSDGSLLRCSQITDEGEVTLEAWPLRNSFMFSENGGNLISIHELNRQMVVRSTDGEFVFDLSDPLDLTTVNANKTSDKACLGTDAFLQLPSSLVYASNGAFIETNGSTAKAVLPEASVVITESGMASAVGVFRSFDGYFSFTDHTGDSVVARLDTYAGTPRISYQGDYKVDWFTQNKRLGKVYAIIDGTVYKYADGYSANGKELELLVKTKAYSLGNAVAWMRAVFTHNTGGNYFRLRVFIDEVDIGYYSFMSTTKTLNDQFWFGPYTGEFIQLQFEGQYDAYGEISLPVKVYANG